MSISTLPQVLRPAQVADYLGLSEWTVRRRMDDGTIPFTKVGAKRYVRVVDLELLMDPTAATSHKQSSEADGGTTSSPGPSAASRPYASETPGLPTESRGSTSSASTVIEAVHTSIGRSKTRPDSGASAAAVESGREVASGGGTDEPS